IRRFRTNGLRWTIFGSRIPELSFACKAQLLDSLHLVLLIG
ncbi:hypothetical protein V3C99_000138, partial [Haemonchus contortus]